MNVKTADGEKAGTKKHIAIVPEINLKNKPITYTSDGKPNKIPNGSTHYAAIIDADNSVTQAKTKTPKDEKSNPFDIARDLYGDIENAAEIVNIIETQKDGFDLVRKGEHLNIKGAGSNTADRLGIPGTHYKIDNLDKYPNVGKLIDPKTAVKDTLPMERVNYIDPLIGLAKNISNKEKVTQTTADFAVDLTKVKVEDAAGAAVAATVTKALMDTQNMLKSSHPSMWPAVAVGAAAGLVTGNVIGRIDDQFNISGKAKDSLGKGLDTLVNTDSSKPNNGRPIERHDPPRKHERADKPEKPETSKDRLLPDRAPTQEKPEKTVKPDKHDPPPKHERAEKPEKDSKPDKNEREDKPDNKHPKTDKPSADNKPSRSDPFRDDKPDNKQPKNDKPKVDNPPPKKDPFKEDNPDNRQPKADKPSPANSNKPSSNANKSSGSTNKPAPAGKTRGHLLD